MNNKKTGFSLMEALVAMLILSLFFIASSKVITRKQDVEFQANPHGYYECYVMNGVQWEHRALINANIPPEQQNQCVFEPPTGVSYVSVHYFDGAQYYTTQQVILNQRITLTSPSQIDVGSVFDDDRAIYQQAQSNPNINFNDFVQQRAAEFITYLRLTHPNSNIFTNWEQTGRLPDQAVLIAW